jgi:hypothetical protein
MPRPSVGRIVHYVSYGTPGGEYTSECRAAVITKVAGPFSAGDGSLNEFYQVGLAVLNPTGVFFNEVVQQQEGVLAELSGGTWHWPERVED